MIHLKLSFNSDEKSSQFENQDGALLSDEIARVCEDAPLGRFEPHDVLEATVNGLLITPDLWAYTKVYSRDVINLTPKIGSGESGQIFKQFAIIAVSLVASFYVGPYALNAAGVAYGGAGALAVAAITIGATLLLNGLIPPPVPDIDGVTEQIEKSQMYAISGQSNQMRRLGTVPKVYGVHRMFPTVAAVPYTELGVDPDTGETVQYLYAIYDFGLGSMTVADLKIGDTPLTTDSFTDFDYRFVDLMKPEIDADEFDERLESEFQYYRNSRDVTPLSLAIEAGGEYIQFSDVNTDGNAQEIILDFVAPAGLYGVTSQGNIATRQINLELQFALVGSSDWRSYNDMDYVDSFSSIGGKEVNEFSIRLATAGQGISDYYVGHVDGNYSYNVNENLAYRMFIRPGTNKLLVLDNTHLAVGSKVFFGNSFLGKIQSLSNLVGPNTEITLDRPTANKLTYFAYLYTGHIEYQDSIPTFVAAPTDIKKIKVHTSGDGVAAMASNSTSAVYGSFRFTPSIAGQYQIRVRRVSTVGAFSEQKADDLTWTGLTTAYKTPPIITDKRHCFMELRIKATDQLNGHVQNLSGIVSAAIKVYDSDTETWSRMVSNNPAWVFVDLLTGEVNKKPVDLARLHLPSISSWAEYCAEIPTPPDGAEYFEPRFQCNFVLDYNTTLQGVLAQVSNAAQASINVIDGKYGVLVDRLQTVPVQIFTPRNSKDFSSTRLYGPRPHGVRVKYIDQNINWEMSDAFAYDNGYTSETATEFDDLTSFACTNHEQAWRFGRYMLAQNKLRQETISLLVDFENLVCTRGDYVQITQDVMRVGGTPARVKDVSGTIITIDDSLEIDPLINYGYVFRASSDGDIETSTLTPLTPSTFDVDGAVPSIGDLIIIGEVGSTVYDCIVKSISPNDDLSANLVLIEKADAIFEYESTSELPEYDPQISNTSRPDFSPPIAITDLTVAANTWKCSTTRSGYEYYVDLTWTIPGGSVYELFEIWVSDGRGYKAFDTTRTQSYRYIVDQLRLDIEHKFKVVAVSATGKKLQLIAMPEVTATPETKSTPPSDVDSLNMSITNQVLQLSWMAIDDCDVAEYTLRFSPDNNDVWESSIPLANVTKDVNSVSVQARTGVYMIKAIDYNGNQSASVAMATTTIPNLFDLNVIETINDAPDFDGTLQQVELLGEAVILEEQVPGTVDDVVYYPIGYYEYEGLLDLDEVYSVRLQSQIRADGLKKGELMSEWEALEDVENLNTSLHSDWNAALQYRATNEFAAMADWVSLDTVDHINYGAGTGFTDWRDIPTVGDATGRIFQFRTKLESFTPNVTPRLFDATVKADMPDRIDSFENLVSHPTEAYAVTYDPVFKGPGTSPNIQISIDDGETGDYWTFDYKTLEGFAIRFYDNGNNQVSRQFDVVAKGFGRRHTAAL